MKQAGLGHILYKDNIELDLAEVWKIKYLLKQKRGENLNMPAQLQWQRCLRKGTELLVAGQRGAGTGWDHQSLNADHGIIFAI